MSDLISKGLLIEHLDVCLAESDGHTPLIDVVLLAVKCAVEQMPTVDAEPIRHGHWEIDEADGSYTCECGLMMWDNDLINGNANYCPNCGAKMDEVSE